MERLIDADRLKAHYCWWAGGSKEMSIDEAKKTFDTIIDVQPTVDAEPVVRCEDCIYRDGKTPGQPNILCWQMHSDDYCSYGTKREVGTYCENIVSVVRCKDCRYFNKYGFKLEYTECTHFDCDVTEEGYCAWGERREDGHTER